MATALLAPVYPLCQATGAPTVPMPVARVGFRHSFSEMLSTVGSARSASSPSVSTLAATKRLARVTSAEASAPWGRRSTNSCAALPSAARRPSSAVGSVSALLGTPVRRATTTSARPSASTFAATPSATAGSIGLAHGRWAGSRSRLRSPPPPPRAREARRAGDDAHTSSSVPPVPLCASPTTACRCHRSACWRTVLMSPCCVGTPPQAAERYSGIPDHVGRV